MNKLLFTLERQFNSNITLIANNHKDLEEYLIDNYDWDSVEIIDNTVYITERPGFNIIHGELQWVTHI